MRIKRIRYMTNESYRCIKRTYACVACSLRHRSQHSYEPPESLRPWLEEQVDVLRPCCSDCDELHHIWQSERRALSSQQRRASPQASKRGAGRRRPSRGMRASHKQASVHCIEMGHGCVENAWRGPFGWTWSTSKCAITSLYQFFEAWAKYV